MSDRADDMAANDGAGAAATAVSTSERRAGEITEVLWSAPKDGELAHTLKWIVLVLFFLFIGVLLGGFVVSVFGHPEWMFPVSIFIPIFGGWFLVNRREFESKRAEIRSLLAQPTKQPPDVLLRNALDIAERAPLGMAIAEFCKHMLASGRGGGTFRIGAGDAPSTVQPFEVSFEIQELDEAAIEPGLLPPPEPPTGWRRWLVGATGNDPNDSTMGRAARGSARQRRMGWIFFCTMFLAFAIYDFARHGRLSLMSAMFFLGAALQAITHGVISWRNGSATWFAVPGGLVVRRDRILQSKDEYRLIRREDAVCCVNGGIIYVADSQRVWVRNATLAETNFFLRAWLSPLPPPTAQQLSDLQ